MADSRGSLCSPKAGFGRIRLLPRRAAYGLSCELAQPANTWHSRLQKNHVGKDDLAARIRSAVDKALREDNVRTGDLGGAATTKDLTQAILRRLG